MSHVAAALAEPTTGTLARRPTSARRTSHIDMLFDDPTPGVALRLRGRARDLCTSANGEARVVAEASIDGRLGDGHRLHSLHTQPVEPAVEGLLGLEVGRGFRAALGRTAWQTTAAGDPLHLLLDDLPVAALISGYVTLYRGDRPHDRVHPDPPGEPPVQAAAAMVKEDICSGWRHDGTMMVELRSGGGFPAPVGPPAPRLTTADPIGWHQIDDLPPNSMRRRRLVDVVWGEPLAVHAMFRDTHTGPDGVETVLHEYTVEATVDPLTLRVLGCRATPRSLPWPECPAAAASALRLEGQSVGELRSFVQHELRGISTCTHLNDLLRSLGEVARLHVLAETISATEKPATSPAAKTAVGRPRSERP
jgi:hypothetical protein